MTLNPVLVFTALGPVLGGLGLLSQLDFLFWLGVAIAAITLFMNIASGVFKLPVFEVVIIVPSAIYVEPWFFGAGIGLLVATALGTIFEFIGLKSEGRL